MEKKVKLTLMFYKANGPKTNTIDKLISWWTKGPYSHVEIAYRYKNKTKMMCSAITKGYGLKGGIRCTTFVDNNEIYDYIDIVVTEKELTLIIGFLNRIKNDKYDRFGILGFILPTQDRTNEWFCSELVSNCLKIIGFEPMWTLDPSNVSPNKLYKLVNSYLNNLSEVK